MACFGNISITHTSLYGPWYNVWWRLFMDKKGNDYVEYHALQLGFVVCLVILTKRQK